MAEFTVPPAMVQAAARAAFNLDRQAGHDWWPDATPPERAIYLTKSEVALTAALSVCEVREEPGLRQANTERPELNGDLWQDDRRPNPYDIAAEFELWRDVEPPWSCSRIRRLHITTPAEEADRDA